MTPDQYARLNAQPLRVLRVEDLQDKRPRTLLYGYTLERDTFHLYLGADAQLHRVIYDHHNAVTQYKTGAELPLEDCFPDKRAYPARCDYEACSRLVAAGVRISFTGYDPAESARSEEPLWYGLRIAQLREPLPPLKVRLAVQDLPVDYQSLAMKDALAATIAGQVSGALWAVRDNADSRTVERWLDNVRERCMRTLRRLAALDPYAPEPVDATEAGPRAVGVAHLLNKLDQLARDVYAKSLAAQARSMA